VSHGNENHVGFLDAFGGAGRERKPSGRHVLLHEFFESRLVNGYAADWSSLTLAASLSTHMT